MLEVKHEAQQGAGWTLHLLGDFGEIWVAGYGGWTSALTFTSLGGALLEIDRHLALLNKTLLPAPKDVGPWILELSPSSEDVGCAVLRPRHALLHHDQQLLVSAPPFLSTGPHGFIGHFPTDDEAYDALNRTPYGLK